MKNCIFLKLRFFFNLLYFKFIFHTSALWSVVLKLAVSSSHLAKDEKTIKIYKQQGEENHLTNHYKGNFTYSQLDDVKRSCLAKMNIQLITTMGLRLIWRPIQALCGSAHIRYNDLEYIGDANDCA